jgi:hypothetical protein
VPARVTPDGVPAHAAPELRIGASPTLAPSSISEIDVEEVLLPQAWLPAADEFSEADAQSRIFTARAAPPNGDAGPRGAITEAAFNLFRAALQPAPPKSGDGAHYLNQSAPLDPSPSPDGSQRATNNAGIATARTNMPPPPFRGALPSAQPIVPPSITADAPLAVIAHRLLGDTEAAIARQTLLQIASLPDRGEVAVPHADLGTPRWAFEIPFATSGGTAIAQFEISRDGGASAIEAAKQVWRARFSLDVEPAGPVHALVSWSGDTTSVRIWAERPATAGQLRAGASQLSDALNRAELPPGDIVIRQGAPTQSVSAPTGHFLDRAL